jgi:hypothetical protein
MGRTFSPALTSAPVIVDPDQSHDEMYPPYPLWSYENPWDPDSDAFFKDAVYEAIVPTLPLEPVTPVESTDGSSLDSSGRGTPGAELAPVLGQISPSNQDMEMWLEGASTGNNVAAISNLPPLSTLRRHSTSELRRGAPAQPHFVSSAAFERFHTRQFNRARDLQQQQQRFPAMVMDGELDIDLPITLRSEGMTLRTSEISPIQLPSSQSRAAISLALQQQQQQQQQHHPRLARPVTPPPVSPPSVQVLSATPGGEARQPSPPPSVSPRIYNWPAAAHSAPDSPTLPTRIRAIPARWPVY